MALPTPAELQAEAAAAPAPGTWQPREERRIGATDADCEKLEGGWVVFRGWNAYTGFGGTNMEGKTWEEWDESAFSRVSTTVGETRAICEQDPLCAGFTYDPVKFVFWKLKEINPVGFIKGREGRKFFDVYIKATAKQAVGKNTGEINAGQVRDVAPGWIMFQACNSYTGFGAVSMDGKDADEWDKKAIGRGPVKLEDIQEACDLDPEVQGFTHDPGKHFYWRLKDIDPSGFRTCKGGYVYNVYVKKRAVGISHGPFGGLPTGLIAPPDWFMQGDRSSPALTMDPMEMLLPAPPTGKGTVGKGAAPGQPKGKGDGKSRPRREAVAGREPPPPVKPKKKLKPKATPCTITLGGPGFEDGREDIVLFACHEMAARKKVTPPDFAVVASHILCHVEFSEPGHAAAFFKASIGEHACTSTKFGCLKFDNKTFKVEHPLAGGKMPKKAAAEGEKAEAEELKLDDAGKPILPEGYTLPEGWEVRKSRSTGRVYFANVKLGKSQFVPPSSAPINREFSGIATPLGVARVEAKLAGSSKAAMLTGVNKDMWANYIAMTKDMAPQRKRAKV